ncbi:MAG: peptide deformylase [Vulcanibacillus sp.]
MSIKVVIKNGDVMLREKSKPVNEITQRTIKLLDNMAETMYDSDGVGLAAVQISILKRIVVIDIGEGLIEMINPEIIEKDGEQIGAEGCLSVPGIIGNVNRAERVKAKALNRQGEEFFIEGTGLLARAIQHEIDHLDGILFIDIAEDCFKQDDLIL